LLIFCLIIFAITNCSYDYDIIISNGTVYDGSGNPSIKADIGIKNGKIKTIGQIKKSSKNTIDATNLMVSPGFIDVHTHCDRRI